jgi:hypothetical protein
MQRNSKVVRRLKFPNNNRLKTVFDVCTMIRVIVLCTGSFYDGMYAGKEFE